MNLILIEKKDYVNDSGLVRISGRRFDHIINIINPGIGDQLKCGELGGCIGVGTVKSINQKDIELKMSLAEQPPDKLPITLILALPRPIYLKRILQNITSMGVEKIYIINSWRVEKSYWQSKVLDPDIIEEQLKIGLEQAKDTVLPFIKLCKYFSSFIEEDLGDIISGKKALLADPRADKGCPSVIGQPLVLAVGPEGGFIDPEIDKLISCGFLPVRLGARTLKTETAVTAFISQYFMNYT
jgi:RsmE family RNA methyltransferase